jgi:lipopolysaccharide export system permease protein
VDFIFLVQFVWLQIDELVGKGLPFDKILELMWWVAVWNISMGLPLATLFASLMAMGNLGESNELLAMKASGISLRRILYPLYCLIAFVGVCSFFLSSDVVPHAFLRMRTMFQEIKKTNPELSIPEDVFYNGIEKISIRVARKDALSGALVGVMIYNHKEGEGNVSVTIADTAYIKQSQDSRYILFRLINGTTYSETLKNNRMDMKNHPFDRRFFTEQNMSIDLGETENHSFEAMFKDNALAKSTATLNRDADSVRAKRQTIVDKFEKEQIESSSSFKYSLKKDTLDKRRKELPFGVDTTYATSTATQKMLWLDQMSANVTRISGYWDNELREIQWETKKLKIMEYERNKKYTLAFACIIFFLIGSSLGAIIRKGGLGLPAVISILFFVIYWVIDTICGKMVKNDDWSPIFGSWFPSMILAPLGVFFSYKASTDSQLFNIDAYVRLFNLVFGRMRKLIRPVDIDTISPMPDNEVQIMLTDNQKLVLFETLISNYFETYRRGKLLRSNKSTQTAIAMLTEIKTLYDYLLSFYIAVNDEIIHSTIKRFPDFNPSEMQPPQFLVSQNILLKIPCSLILFFMRIRQSIKLDYILKDMLNLNSDINKYLYDRHKT